MIPSIQEGRILESLHFRKRQPAAGAAHFVADLTSKGWIAGAPGSYALTGAGATALRLITPPTWWVMRYVCLLHLYSFWRRNPLKQTSYFGVGLFHGPGTYHPYRPHEPVRWVIQGFGRWARFLIVRRVSGLEFYK